MSNETVAGFHRDEQVALLYKDVRDWWEQTVFLYKTGERGRRSSESRMPRAYTRRFMLVVRRELGNCRPLLHTKYYVFGYVVVFWQCVLRFLG